MAKRADIGVSALKFSESQQRRQYAMRIDDGVKEEGTWFIEVLGPERKTNRPVVFKQRVKATDGARLGRTLALRFRVPDQMVQYASRPTTQPGDGNEQSSEGQDHSGAPGAAADR